MQVARPWLRVALLLPGKEGRGPEAGTKAEVIARAQVRSRRLLVRKCCGQNPERAGLAGKGGQRSGQESQMEEREPAGTSQGVSVGMV